MTTLDDVLHAPSAREKEVAAFNLFARVMAQDPQLNPWHTAEHAFECTEAFFEIATRRRKERR
jgi:hypothetical protein